MDMAFIQSCLQSKNYRITKHARQMMGERGITMKESDETKDLCDFCGGELEAGVTELELRVEGELIICENLPAPICRQCGEAYFSAQVSHQIDDIIARRKELKPLRYETVPIFSPELVNA